MHEEVTITTHRGIRLSGTLTEGESDAAVIFSHGFLDERSSRGRFTDLMTAYADAGYATLAFDYSGCGRSDDEVVLVSREIEDFNSVSDFLSDAGYPRQAVHGHSLGSLIALRANSPWVRTMILTGALTGPLDYPWGEIFSAAQLDELGRTGRMRVPDDGPTPREATVIAADTLASFSTISQSQLLAPIRCPVLLIHGGQLIEGEEHQLLTHSRVGLPLLPPGSRLEVLRGADHALLDYIEAVARHGLDWLAEHLPVEAEGPRTRLRADGRAAVDA